MELPSYAELPEVDGVKVSWGLWGDDDRLGCLNLLTPERAVRGAGLVIRGAVFPLDAAVDEIDPPMFGRPELKHEIYTFPGGNAFDDHLAMWDTQASTQWDGFRHMRDPKVGFYNRQAGEDLGIDHWAERGIVGRGLLADVARYRPVDPAGPDAIEAADLEGALREQGVAVEPGDVLLVRTGWLGWYRTLDRAARAEITHESGIPGLASTEEMVELLWDLHVAAVAADNPALEVFPVRHRHLHWDLLPRLGIPIGEFWDLDDLAADCAADGVSEFLLTSSPLRLRQGVASPPNALAVK